nr:GNAT family N-acetyltransferase [Streptomyces katsurahamanus]
MVAGIVRVHSVYTPAHLRGRGYAAAVTVEVSRAALAAGAKEVMLFTNAANPTSNALYRRIGYVPVSDFATYDFSYAAPEGGWGPRGVINRRSWGERCLRDPRHRHTPGGRRQHPERVAKSPPSRCPCGRFPAAAAPVVVDLTDPLITVAARCRAATTRNSDRGSLSHQGRRRLMRH